MAGERALEGVTVLDLSQHIAGPYCGKILTGLGAQVIKVEPPGVGDPQRQEPPFAADRAGVNRSGFFFHLNTGKKSVALDLKSSSDRAAFLDLVGRTDVLIESFTASQAAELGLNFEELSRANPSLIRTTISGFGRTGPYRDFEATEIVYMALGGFMHATGDSDREPVKLGGEQSQYHAGLQGALGTLAALHYRNQTGRGQVVDVSISESVTFLTTAVTRTGAIGGRVGNRLMVAPTGNYPSTTLPCKDGYVHVHGKGWDFEALSLLMQEPRLATEELRQAQYGHADEMDALMLPWLRERTKMEILDEAQSLFMPFGPVLNIDEVVADPQHAFRKFFVTIQHPEMGKVTVTEGPIRLGETPWVTERSPLLGEHTKEVLAAPASEAQKKPSRSGSHEQSPTESMALEGLRVLDLTQIIAGPYATQVLGDLGAEVIKIESHTRYDQIRGRARSASANEGPRPYNRTPNFNSINRNKLGLCLNLATESGKDVFKRLVAISDVVIDNFSPRVMKNFGLDYPVLKEINPRIIMISMPSLGSEGPYGNYVMLGPGIDAMSGLQQITGYADRSPLKSGGSYTDQSTGLNTVVATLAALHWREQSGLGQRVEVAMRESITQFIGEYIVDYTMNGRLPTRWGNRSPWWAPQGCYPCVGDDSWVVLSVRTDEEWRCLCQIMGKEDLAKESRYATMQGRQKYHDELDAVIGQWTSQKTSRQVMEELQRASIPAGAVLNQTELLDDPQIQARGHYVTGMHPEGGETRYGFPGFRLSNTPLRIRRPAPCFAEHTEMILKERLGMSAQDLQMLYDNDTIAAEPSV